METITLNVEGMTCNGCVANVTRLLLQVPGVKNAAVTLHPGAAKVDFDPARTSVPALKAAIEEAGYDVAA